MSRLIPWISVKKAWTDEQIPIVNLAYTTQNRCERKHWQKMGLADRDYHCSCCNLDLSKDYNAALNVLKLRLKIVK